MQARSRSFVGNECRSQVKEKLKAELIFASKEDEPARKKLKTEPTSTPPAGKADKLKSGDDTMSDVDSVTTYREYL